MEAGSMWEIIKYLENELIEMRKIEMDLRSRIQQLKVRLLKVEGSSQK